MERGAVFKLASVVLVLWATPAQVDCLRRFRDVMGTEKEGSAGLGGGPAPPGWMQGSAAWNDTAYPVWPPNDTRWESSWRGGRMKVLLTSDGPALVGSRITFYAQLHFPRGQRAQANGRAVWAENATVNGSHVTEGEEVYPELNHKSGGRRSFPDGRPLKRGRRDEDYVYVFYTRGRFWEIGSQVTATVTLDTRDIPVGVHRMQLLIYQERHNNQFIPLGNGSTEYTITDQIPFSVEINQLNDQNYLDNRFVENRDVIFTTRVHDPSGYLRDSIAQLTYTWNFGDESGSLITQMPTCRHAYAAAGNYRPQLVLQAIIPTKCGTLNATVIPEQTTATTTTTTTTATTTTTTTAAPAVTTADPSSPTGSTVPTPNVSTKGPVVSTPPVPGTRNVGELLLMTVAELQAMTDGQLAALSTAGDLQLPGEPDGQPTVAPPSPSATLSEEPSVVTPSNVGLTVAASGSSAVPVAATGGPGPATPAAPSVPAPARLVKRQAVAWRPPQCQVHRYGSYSTRITVVPEIQSVKVVPLSNAQTGDSIQPGLTNFMVTCEGSVPTQVCTVVSDTACVAVRSSACRNVSVGSTCAITVQESFNASGTYCLNVSLSDDVSFAVSSTQVTVGSDGAASASAMRSAVIAGVFLAVAIAGAAVYIHRRFKEYSPVYQPVLESGGGGGGWASYAGMRRLLGLGASDESSPLLAATGRVI